MNSPHERNWNKQDKYLPKKWMRLLWQFIETIFLHFPVISAIGYHNTQNICLNVVVLNQVIKWNHEYRYFVLSFSRWMLANSEPDAILLEACLRAKLWNLPCIFRIEMKEVTLLHSQTTISLFESINFTELALTVWVWHQCLNQLSHSYRESPVSGLSLSNWHYYTKP